MTFDDIDFLQRPYVPNWGWPIPHESLKRYYTDAFRFLNVEYSELPRSSRSLGDVHLEAVEWWSAEPDLGLACRERIERSRLIRFLPDTSAAAIDADETGAVTQIRLVNQHGEAQVPVHALVLS
ncbi:hypothetical protein [Agrobacterium fabrum]|uniref:hypothetical protein n=1 Tax=Agrobacterium fabrum TaxID=1176649 RepID=UPI000F0CBCB4|nr:hypothetical protein At12D13_49150 [Agrobacterium fabrum]